MNNNMNVLDEINKGCYMGIDALDIVIKKVEKKETITEEEKEEKYEHALRNSTSMSRFHGAKTSGSNMGNNFLLDKIVRENALTETKKYLHGDGAPWIKQWFARLPN